MRKINLCLTAAAVMLGAVPFAANAEDEIVYGTMNIPYSDFYAAEFGESPNAYEVDAFSSATTGKWSKNGEGELFEGTYNQPNEDGTGSILGVTYPVAVSKADLDAMGDENYGFTAVEAVPEAYKKVTFSDGKASFSAVQDTSPVTAEGASVKLSTETPWGDYLIDVENSPELGAIYGALLRTADGGTYAMRHEENIWRGELAWSSGIKTSEPHGNALSYENFTSLMGATISEVVFITSNGYTTIPTETYVPVKFAYEAAVEAASCGSGETPMTLSGFPEDYAKVYSVNGEGFTVSDTSVGYSNALAGAYKLSISDANGKYADASADFILSTDAVPAVYADGKLVKAEGASDEELANYIKNISSVSVNGTAYSASGKRGVKIIAQDGTVDFSAAVRGANVFDGSGNYEIKVTSSGYSNDMEFAVKDDTPTTTEAPETTQTPKETTVKTTTEKTTAKGKTTTGKPDDSPKTGVAGAAIPMALMGLAAAGAFVSRRKNG